METAVRKATRLEYLPPKQKHLTTLNNIAIENPSDIDGIMLSLGKRLKERSWIITFKVLVIVHYLMREANCVHIVEAVTKNPSVLDSSRIKDKASAPASVQNIYLYRVYLDERIIAFRNLKRDYVYEASTKKEGRLRHLSITDGLLKETPAVQRQIDNIIKCKFHFDDKNSSITFFAFKMIIGDLLALFQAANEGIINILEHYFEMNKTDAKEALKIYKEFASQTELTIDYLKEARNCQSNLQMTVPSIKHAPLSLLTALEEYLDDNTVPVKDDKVKQSISQATVNPYASGVSQSPCQMSTSPQQYMPNPTNDYTAQYPSKINAFSNIDNKYNQEQEAAFNPFSLQSNPAPSAYNPFMVAPPQQFQTSTNYGFSNSSYLKNQGSGYEIIPVINGSTNNQNFNGKSATFSANSRRVSNTNPFRSLSMSGPSSYLQNVATVSPMQYQTVQQHTSTFSTSNPFSPMTPPLTPNNTQHTHNNPPMQPYLQIQNSTTMQLHTSSASNNPFNA